MLLAVLGIVAVIVLTLGTALFVAAEFSLVAADRPELEGAARGGDASAQRALDALRTLSFQLSGAQLGITITTLAVGFLAEPSISRLIRPVFETARLPIALAETLAVIVSLVLATVLQMVLGELVPKNWAIAQPTAVARAVAAPMQVFTALFRIVISACNGLANVIVRGFGIEPQEELRSARSAAELGSLVRTSAEVGTLPPTTATMLARSLAFSQRVAGEVMTPRTQIVSLDEAASVAALMQASRETGHSRFPLAGRFDDHSDLDDLTRLVHIKKAFTVVVDQRDSVAVTTISDPLPRVPDSLRLEPLLALLRKPGLQMAVVIDEYGGTAGIVTLEDVVEELIGEVEDEHDPAVSPPPPVPTDGRFELPARLRIDEVRRVVPGFEPPDGPYDTLAGLLLQQLGKLADLGDSTVVGDWTLVATQIDGRRVDAISLQRTGESA